MNIKEKFHHFWTVTLGPDIAEEVSLPEELKTSIQKIDEMAQEKFGNLGSKKAGKGSGNVVKKVNISIKPIEKAPEQSQKDAKSEELER